MKEILKPIIYAFCLEKPSKSINPQKANSYQAKFIQCLLVLLVLIFTTQYVYGGIVESFMIAVENSRSKKVKKLLTKRVDVNPRNEKGVTALMILAQTGHTETVKVLLEQGADINAKNKDGWTALMVAANKGQTETVKVLLEQGADVKAKTNGDVTALMLAEENGHKEIVQLLREAGAVE